MTNAQQNGPKSMTAGDESGNIGSSFMLVTARVHVKKFVIQCTIQWVYIFLGIRV
jgi:hypothetical protein